MASSSSSSAQNQTKKEDNNGKSNVTSERTNNQPPMQGYPAPQGYYHGYPPPQGQYYPGYHTPYPGQPLSQAPPAANYHNQHYVFLRGIVIGLAFLLILSLSMSFLVWLILRPRLPTFQLDTLIVPNLNTSTPQFQANWDANFTVTNTNKKLAAYFDLIEGVVVYKLEIVSAITIVPPFVLETKNHSLMHVEFATNDPRIGTLREEAVREMNQDRSNGAVVFDIWFDINSTFKSGSWWLRRPNMTVVCKELKVEFGQGPIGTLKNVPKNCLVYV